MQNHAPANKKKATHTAKNVTTKSVRAMRTQMITFKGVSRAVYGLLAARMMDLSALSAMCRCYLPRPCVHLQLKVASQRTSHLGRESSTVAASATGHGTAHITKEATIIITMTTMITVITVTVVAVTTTGEMTVAVGSGVIVAMGTVWGFRMVARSVEVVVGTPTSREMIVPTTARKVVTGISTSIEMISTTVVTAMETTVKIASRVASIVICPSLETAIGVDTTGKSASGEVTREPSVRIKLHDVEKK